MSSHFIEAMHMFPNAHLQYKKKFHSFKWTPKPKLVLTYRAPWTNANSKLFSYESVVDPMRNVVEGLSIIRTGEKRKERFVCFPCYEAVSRYISNTNAPSVKSWGSCMWVRIQRTINCRQHKNDLGNTTNLYHDVKITELSYGEVSNLKLCSMLQL